MGTDIADHAGVCSLEAADGEKLLPIPVQLQLRQKYERREVAYVSYPSWQ